MLEHPHHPLQPNPVFAALYSLGFTSLTSELSLLHTAHSLIRATRSKLKVLPEYSMSRQTRGVGRYSRPNPQFGEARPRITERPAISAFRPALRTLRDLARRAGVLPRRERELQNWAGGCAGVSYDDTGCVRGPVTGSLTAL
ncbi:hypothetical protein BC938DRAFT_472334 [Jimgerdemannia flammicorona]|uniref:Uncharacterized protein n=1 Tax=Jimgerdemannia flammicorona TaxID=994334 RepID=A0A433Q6A6_9FUNG|nr:hypothetical protein BC938DRAFT_472334 [Jimgerdemannia flammicorona]